MPTPEDLKSPLIEENQDGTYSITFYYQSPDPSLNPIVTLDSGDLHEWMIDKSTGQVRAFARNEETGLYSLKLDGIPSAPFFATYRFKVTNGAAEQIIHDAANKDSLTICKLNLPAEQGQKIEDIDDQKTSYIRLQDAKFPDWVDIKPSSKIAGTVTHEKFGDNSAAGTPRQKRDIWMYKPSGFDDLKSNRKVIFMLDGRDLCERLVPYIDKTPGLSNTAIVFINPGEYEPPIPGRVQEYYWDDEKSTGFVDLLSNELIPHYVHELEVVSNRNVILEAHSLAAFPMAAVVKKIPDKIGGLNLISPALNQTGELFSDSSDLKCKKIPISMQIGQLETAEPPIAHKQDNRMTDESRLEATGKLHQELQSCKYKVEPELRINAYGHDSIHLYEGTIQGMQFIQDCWSKAEINRTIEMKSRLNEIINRGISSADKVKQKSHTESAESSTPSPLSITPKLRP